jgi:hypothetical protein
MFKKGYKMNNKTITSSRLSDALDLAAAVEQFVADGGVINKVATGGGLKSVVTPPPANPDNAIAEDERREKLELLRHLVAKGAGISALQYALRMNRKDIKQLATENGVKIEFSRPINDMSHAHRDEASDIDDTVAGHAMHYSSLGYTAPEIAKILGLKVRQVWDIGKAYRIEFRKEESDAPP